MQSKTENHLIIKDITQTEQQNFRADSLLNKNYRLFVDQINNPRRILEYEQLISDISQMISTYYDRAVSDKL